MCKLSRMSDGVDLGLYVLLRSSGGAAQFHKVRERDSLDDGVSPKTIESMDVDVNHNNRGNNASFPYFVTLIIPTEVQTKMMYVDSNENMEAEVFRNTMMEDIASKRKTIKRSIDGLNRDMIRLRAVQEELRLLNRELCDLDDIERMVERGEQPVITYAYGRHPDQVNNKEYCWQIPFGMESEVLPGLRAVVSTAYGRQPIVVTRVERSNRILGHRYLVAVDHAEHENNNSTCESGSFDDLI